MHVGILCMHTGILAYCACWHIGILCMLAYWHIVHVGILCMLAYWHIVHVGILCMHVDMVSGVCSMNARHVRNVVPC